MSGKKSKLTLKLTDRITTIAGLVAGLGLVVNQTPGLGDGAQLGGGLAAAVGAAVLGYFTNKGTPATEAHK